MKRANKRSSPLLSNPFISLKLGQCLIGMLLLSIFATSLSAQDVLGGFVPNPDNPESVGVDNVGAKRQWALRIETGGNLIGSIDLQIARDPANAAADLKIEVQTNDEGFPSGTPAGPAVVVPASSVPAKSDPVLETPLTRIAFPTPIQVGDGINWIVLSSDESPQYQGYTTINYRNITDPPGQRKFRDNHGAWKPKRKKARDKPYDFYHIIYGVPTIDSLLVQIENLITNNPNTELADKLEDVLIALLDAINELDKTPPDVEAASGNLEGAAGDLEATWDDGLLEASKALELLTDLTGIARGLVVDAIESASSQGGDPDKILEAESYLLEGDSFADVDFFKDAAAAYKDAVAKAAGSI